ncbi:CPBP family intramembrane glutamic endopeptidase [Alterisphingorhabdus coralli]|uniref:Type II CAAX endopeptidase family protein n=1 Tax=Alterisphingorhabdus coralli TaxID=3071408 RepID=A0AA97I089_9SPHN|nr:type II CAAX endopeptidase family protein [Parasphingorhabdus sp. SCSIO 66989]WOE75499.1 type II CAAX endopeptidase family protein [Parasphingorhabdus sp. SCSIO 66989]
MKDFIHRKPFVFFYSVAFGLACLVWAYILGMEILYQSLNGPEFSLFQTFGTTQAEIRAASPVLHHHSDSIILYVATYIAMPIAFAGFFFPYAPSVAAMLTTGIGWGKDTLFKLLGCYKPIRGNLSMREGLKIYLSLYALICLAVVMIILKEQFFGDPERISGFLNHLGVIDWQIFLGAWFVASFFNQGALLEELGWRGFAMPLMIRKMGSPLIGALIVGVAWTFWHFPREIPPLLAGQQTLMGVFDWHVWFILSCCSASIVMTYFCNITGGSVIPAIIIHGMLNFVGGMFSTETVGARSAFTGESPIMWFICALIVLAIAGRDLGWKRRLELHGGDENDPSYAWSRPPNEAAAMPNSAKVPA